MYHEANPEARYVGTRTIICSSSPLDVCCVVGEIKRRPSGFPTKGVPNGPQPRAYPRVCPPGRGPKRFVLRDRRRLCQSQSQRAASLPIPKEDLRDSEVITLTLFQQLRGIESERSSFLRDVA